MPDTRTISGYSLIASPWVTSARINPKCGASWGDWSLLCSRNALSTFLPSAHTAPLSRPLSTNDVISTSRNSAWRPNRAQRIHASANNVQREHINLLWAASPGCQKPWPEIEEFGISQQPLCLIDLLASNQSGIEQARSHGFQGETPELRDRAAAVHRRHYRRSPGISVPVALQRLGKGAGPLVVGAGQRKHIDKRLDRLAKGRIPAAG